MKKALVTGITGQDGAYLARLLLQKGYEVHGAYRRASLQNFWRIQELGIHGHPRLHLHEYDLTDLNNSICLLELVEPDEVYNLAARSFAGLSPGQSEATAQITGLGVLRLLEAIRLINKNIRFYQASTAEMFGASSETPQSETTPFYPRSVYGIAKLYAHWTTINYSESYGIFASPGIIFNHESPLRGLEFVTRKITSGFAKMARGQLEYIELGNLDARRDWGYAPEYVEGMWLTLQHHEPDTFVLATGRTCSVRDFVTLAAKYCGIPLEWRGEGPAETGIDVKSGKVRVKINPRFYRPLEKETRVGNPEKIRKKLGWQAKTSIEDLCAMMARYDLEKSSKS